ncbi:unnamed protein product [Effrenium voratum]|uniref:EF-hand domain-containing protein n=1 Tax=Effrenium voratum TaxID=2562239 RepID=A0AA36JQF9_9DINO|nr:unnamed protein product [Effrenium voratum]
MPLVSVVRWWGSSTRQLRRTLLQGPEKASEVLLRWGVPQHVVNSGSLLGQYLAQNPHLVEDGASAQLSQIVAKVYECFDVEYRSGLGDSGLVLAPRGRRGSDGGSTRRKSHATPAGKTRPRPPRLEPLEPIDASASNSATKSCRSDQSSPSPRRATSPTSPSCRTPTSPRSAGSRWGKSKTSTLTGNDTPALETRPATVAGGTLRLDRLDGGEDLAQTLPGRLGYQSPRFRQKTPVMPSSFMMWNEREKGASERHRAESSPTKKVEQSSKHSAREMVPLSISKKCATKIVKDQGELKRIFDFYDKDGSGLIDVEEFIPLLNRVLKQPEPMNKTEVWKIWDDIDQDGSGQISFEEFQGWYCGAFHLDGNPDRTEFITQNDVPAHEAMIRNIAKKLGLDFFKVDSLWTRFCHADLDANGCLDYSEFACLIQRELAPSGNPVVPDKVVQKFWIEIDADKSGVVSFGEFAAWYMKFLFGGKSPMEQYYAAFGRNKFSFV